MSDNLFFRAISVLLFLLTASPFMAIFQDWKKCSIALFTVHRLIKETVVVIIIILIPKKITAKKKITPY